METKVNVGDKIHIDYINDFCNDKLSESYNNKEGVVTKIGKGNYLHGTWGNLILIPDIDKFTVINN